MRARFTQNLQPLAAILTLAVVAITLDLAAQGLRITGITLTPQHSVAIRYDSNTNAYFILYAGDAVTTISQPVTLALGATGECTLTVTQSIEQPATFFLLREVPLTLPLDLDGDGIDDAFELRHAVALDPLDRGDAFRDYDGDGTANWEEYQFGSDPLLPNPMPAIAPGSHHTLLLKTDGTVWSWGNNFVGQLGNGNFQDQPIPQRILIGGPFVGVAAGDLHSLAIAVGGEVWGWGENESRQLGPFGGAGGSVPSQVLILPNCKRIAAGGALSVAVGADGTVWTSGIITFTPPFVRSWAQFGNQTNWNEVVVGGQYACNSVSPCPPSSCGAMTHSAGLTKSGTLWSWGENLFGQLGISGTAGTNSPVQVGAATNWARIAAGEGHTVALRTDGSLWSWGWNAYGQLGDGTTNNRVSPVRVGNVNDWASVAAGYRHTLALKTDGTLWAWGCNGSGQLGNGTTSSTSSPTRIGSDDDWVAVTAGAEHTVALKSNGSIWAWGSNQYGQVGDGSSAQQSSPVQVGSAYP